MRFFTPIRVASVVACTLIGAFLDPVAADGHHAFTSEFDSNQRVQVEGVVAKLEWMNPHGWLHVDVPGEHGEIQHWRFEMGAPAALIRMGWHRTDLKPGDHVTVEGAAARYQEFTGNARTITLPDGRTVFGGRASDRGDAKQPAPPQQENPFIQ